LPKIFAEPEAKPRKIAAGEIVEEFVPLDTIQEFPPVKVKFEVADDKTPVVAATVQALVPPLFVFKLIFAALVCKVI